MRAHVCVCLCVHMCVCVCVCAHVCVCVCVCVHVCVCVCVIVLETHVTDNDFVCFGSRASCCPL